MQLYTKIYGIAKGMLIGNCIDLSNYINEDERLKNKQMKHTTQKNKVSQSQGLKSEIKEVKNVET